MKNKYEIRGDITVVFLQCKNGKILETTIDTVDLPLANSLSGTWFAGCDSRHNGDYYVVMNIQRVSRSLSRLLLNAPQGHVVDHKSRDTLDNRRCNIRLATIAENGQNRKLSKNSKTGINGVYYDKDEKGWRVDIRVGEKRFNKRFKVFRDAEHFSIQVRKENMPFSQDAMGM